MQFVGFSLSYLVATYTPIMNMTHKTAVLCIKCFVTIRHSRLYGRLFLLQWTCQYLCCTADVSSYTHKQVSLTSVEWSRPIVQNIIT